MAQGFFSRFRRAAAAEVSRPAEIPAPAQETPVIGEIAREIARQGLPPAARKEAISLRLDADVLEWFRAQGPGYQTRINAVLRAFCEAAGEGDAGAQRRAAARPAVTP